MKEPANALARINVGYICLKKRIFGEAIEHLSKAIRLDNDRKATLYAHYYLGLVYLEREMYEDAQTFFRKTLKLGPNLIEAYFELGRALWFAGRRDEAMQAGPKATRPTSSIRGPSGVRKCWTWPRRGVRSRAACSPSARLPAAGRTGRRPGGPGHRRRLARPAGHRARPRPRGRSTRRLARARSARPRAAPTHRGSQRPHASIRSPRAGPQPGAPPSPNLASVPSSCAPTRTTFLARSATSSRTSRCTRRCPSACRSGSTRAMPPGPRENGSASAASSSICPWCAGRSRRLPRSMARSAARPPPPTRRMRWPPRPSRSSRAGIPTGTLAPLLAAPRARGRLRRGGAGHDRSPHRPVRGGVAPDRPATLHLGSGSSRAAAGRSWPCWCCGWCGGAGGRTGPAEPPWTSDGWLSPKPRTGLNLTRPKTVVASSLCPVPAPRCPLQGAPPHAAVPAHAPQPGHSGGGRGGAGGGISHAGRGASECRRRAARGRLLHPLSDRDRPVGVSVVTAHSLR